jgi:prolyl-tRNA synthetase
MKDLYTFDSSPEAALETYEQVRLAYDNIFADMKLPVLAAKASSGDMGGDMSHEYHLPASIGDDRVIHCSSCDYVINDEIAETIVTGEVPAGTELAVWRGITKDRTRLINVWYPKRIDQPNGEPREYSGVDISIPAIKSLIPDLDSAVGEAAPLWLSTVGGAAEKATELLNILDGRLPRSVGDAIQTGSVEDLWPGEFGPSRPALTVSVTGGWNEGSKPLGLLRVHSGDQCPECEHGTLTVNKAIELGHTFHLGTRYSDPLGANVSVPGSAAVPMQMGCHGIGISRIIGAVAEHFADEKGLNWPVRIAPYSCAIIAKNDSEDAVGVYERLAESDEVTGDFLDVVIDDRQKSLAWKLGDADLVGYPIVVVLGRKWADSGRVEVQCRRLGIKETVALDSLPGVVEMLHMAL